MFARLKHQLQGMEVLVIALLTSLIADSLDIISTGIGAVYVPGIEELNQLMRVPGQHTFWLGPALMLKLEVYLLHLLPFTALLYLGASYAVSKKHAALIASIPLWYIAWHSFGVALENFALTAFFAVWLKGTYF